MSSILALTLGAAAAGAHMLAPEFQDQTGAPFSFQVQRTVLGNAAFSQTFLHGRLRSDVASDSQSITEYEAVEVTVSGSVSRNGVYFRADLPYRVVNYEDDHAPQISAGQRRTFHDRGIGDLRLEAGFKIPRIPLRVKLGRVFPTGETIYGHENPHLGTGMGVASWEPSVQAFTSWWILDGSLEAGLAWRGSQDLKGPYFDVSAIQEGRVHVGDYGRAKASISARLFRDPDHEVYLGGHLIAFSSWTESIEGPVAALYTVQGVRAAIVEMKLRFGKEFCFGVRGFIYPLKTSQGRLIVPDNVISLSLSFGAP